MANLKIAIALIISALMILPAVLVVRRRVERARRDRQGPRDAP